jgi:hypothetical protein
MKSITFLGKTKPSAALLIGCSLLALQAVLIIFAPLLAPYSPTIPTISPFPMEKLMSSRTFV